MFCVRWLLYWVIVVEKITFFSDMSDDLIKRTQSLHYALYQKSKLFSFLIVGYFSWKCGSSRTEYLISRTAVIHVKIKPAWMTMADHASFCAYTFPARAIYLSFCMSIYIEWFFFLRCWVLKLVQLLYLWSSSVVCFTTLHTSDISWQRKLKYFQTTECSIVIQ